MAMSFLTSGPKKRDHVVAVDLGARATKAVAMQRKADGYHLDRYALVDAPVYEKGLSAEMVGEHLKTIQQTLNCHVRHLALALGVTDAMVRQAEMPPIPISDMRQILKSNSKNYLQQDLPGYQYDCHLLPASANGKSDGARAGGASPAMQKLKVLVGGARRQLVDDLDQVTKGLGLVTDAICPGLVGPLNAFELAAADLYSQDIVALVDIGFRNTSICVLQQGELILSRVVAIGGDRITSGLAESLNISYAEAEGIKVGMPQEVQPQLELLLSPLGRELRASLDFFEHQQDKVVSQVFLSGGAARSELVVQILQMELLAPCKGWNPAAQLKLGLPPEQMAEIEQVAPQLAVAIGTALASLS